MRLELMTTDLEGQSTNSYATELSKMILHLPTSHWRRALPILGLADGALFINKPGIMTI